MVLELTQTVNINEYQESSCGVKCGRRVGLTDSWQLHLSRLSRKCGTLDISQLYRPPRPVTGIAFPFFKHYYQKYLQLNKKKRITSLCLIKHHVMKTMREWEGVDVQLHLLTSNLDQSGTVSCPRSLLHQRKLPLVPTGLEGWVRECVPSKHKFLSFKLQSYRSSYYYYFVCEAIGTAATPGLLCQPRVIVKMIVEKQMECRLTGETEVLGENLPLRHFCPSQNPTWPDPGLNPGRRGGKPATNRLRYGAAPYRS
jgi:hypothetical protein